MIATALYHDGRNNYQVNYAGLREQAIKSFMEDMQKRNAVWGKLFVTVNGEELASYSIKS
jgi:hypothetical protein